MVQVEGVDPDYWPILQVMNCVPSLLNLLELERQFLLSAQPTPVEPNELRVNEAIILTTTEQRELIPNCRP